MVHVHEAESLENFGNEYVKYFIDVEQIQEEEIDHVREETCSFAKVLMLKYGKDLCQYRIKAFITLQYFIH